MEIVIRNPFLRHGVLLSMLQPNMAYPGTSQNDESRRRDSASASGNDIPPRSHYRPPRNALIPPQPTLRTHTIRLAVATAIGFLLMLALLMLAVKYAQHDWSRKNERALAPHAPHPSAEEMGKAAAQVGWAYELPPSATTQFLERLNADRMAPTGWLILARGLSSKTDSPLVISSLRMAMAIEGENADIKNDFGAAYLQQKRMKDAALQFHAAEQIRPGFSPALYNLALCAISDRNPARAIQLLGQYLGQRSGDTTALRLQSTLLAQVGRTDDALHLLEKFLKDQPPEQPLFLEAAQLAARLGQSGKALRYLETSLAGNPIQSVVRTYQSGVFRDIRLSGEGDPLAARLAEKARLAFSSPIPEEDIQPLRETAPEAIVR